MTPDRDAIDKLAEELRHAGFPGARLWVAADESVKAVWRRVAVHADALVRQAVDEALRKATAKSHELGQHTAAHAIRAIRCRS